MNYISGVKFQQVADFIVDTDRRVDPSITTKGGIIWCKVNLIDEVFNAIRNSPHKYILITHNGDYALNAQRFAFKTPNVVKWFAQNVDLEHEDLIPLPIGFENETGPSKGKWTDFPFLSEALTLPPLNEFQKFNKSVYVNFTIGNNHNHRSAVFNALRSISHTAQLKPFRQYYDEIRHFKFIASPQGNGIDCHRTWEALYAGAIPLVDDSIHTRYLSKIYSMILIQDWNKINKIEVLLEMAKNLKPLDINTLDISYWFSKIEMCKKEYNVGNCCQLH